VAGEDDVVAIEDNVVPVDALRDVSIRDWVLVNGRWVSTDEQPSVPRRRGRLRAALDAGLAAAARLPRPRRRRPD
jgi:hypothetical protein